MLYTSSSRFDPDYFTPSATMASLASKALPAHLKDAISNGEGNGAFERKHHGKTQSHVVSRTFLQSSPYRLPVSALNPHRFPFTNLLPHSHITPPLFITSQWISYTFPTTFFDECNGTPLPA